MSAQTRAMRGSTLAAVGSPPAAFSFHVVERRHRGTADAHPLDAAHRHRRTIGLILQFVTPAVPVDGGAGNAGRLLARQCSARVRHPVGHLAGRGRHRRARARAGEHCGQCARRHAGRRVDHAVGAQCHFEEERRRRSARRRLRSSSSLPSKRSPAFCRSRPPRSPMRPDTSSSS